VQVPAQLAAKVGATFMCTNAIYFVANLPPSESNILKRMLPCGLQAGAQLGLGSALATVDICMKSAASAVHG
jgi:hypothetical protein